MYKELVSAFFSAYICDLIIVVVVAVVVVVVIFTTTITTTILPLQYTAYITATTVCCNDF